MFRNSAFGHLDVCMFSSLRGFDSGCRLWEEY